MDGPIRRDGQRVRPRRSRHRRAEGRIISVGEERTKGNRRRSKRGAARTRAVRFRRQRRSKDIFLNHADVWSRRLRGNVILKTPRAAAPTCATAARIVRTRGRWQDRRTAEPDRVDQMRARIDYAKLRRCSRSLGVRGNCIVAHGRSDRTAIRNAIRQAAAVAGADLVARSGRLGRMNASARVVAIVTDSTADLLPSDAIARASRRAALRELPATRASVTTSI